MSPQWGHVTTPPVVVEIDAGGLHRVCHAWPSLSYCCRVGMPPCLLIGISAPHHEVAAHKARGVPVRAIGRRMETARRQENSSRPHGGLLLCPTAGGPSVRPRLADYDTGQSACTTGHTRPATLLPLGSGRHMAQPPLGRRVLTIKSRWLCSQHYPTVLSRTISTVTPIPTMSNVASTSNESTW